MRVVSIGTGTGFVKKVDLSIIDKDNLKENVSSLESFNGFVDQTIEAIKADQASLDEDDIESREVFDAHILMLTDPVIKDEMNRLIMDEDLNPVNAYLTASDNILAKMKTIKDSYIRDRKDDFEEVRNRLLKTIYNEKSPLIELDRPTILVGETLTFQLMAKINKKLLKGVIVRHVSDTTHAILIAQAMGIPVIEYDLMDDLEDGESIRVVAYEITQRVEKIPESIIVNEANRKKLVDKINAMSDHKPKEKVDHALPKSKPTKKELQASTTLDVHATIAFLDDVDDALDIQAGGIGLYRTEMFYAMQNHLPTEAMLYKEYKAVFDKVDPLIRTFDFGRDKEISYLNDVSEANQGIGYALKHQLMFKVQLRAILRASSDSDYVKILFPLVTSIEAFEEASKLIETVQKELADEGTPYQKNVYKGIMIETIQTVYKIDTFLDVVDFFNIGTNDLFLDYKRHKSDTVFEVVETINNDVGYGMSLENLLNKHPQFHEVFDDVLEDGLPTDNQSIDFLFMSIISTVVKRIKAINKPVGICGRMAENTFFTMFFMWLPVDFISVPPKKIEYIRQVTKLNTKYNYVDFYEMIFNKI